MGKTHHELEDDKIDNLSVEECKRQLKLYYNSFGEINQLYNKCGRCIHYDEYGCWRDECIRNKPTYHSFMPINDLKEEKEK
jgi:hypothetical protein